MAGSGSGRSGSGRGSGGKALLAQRAASYGQNARARQADARRVRAISNLKANQRLMNDRTAPDAVRSRAGASMMLSRKAVSFYRGQSSVEGMQLTAAMRKGSSSGRGRRKRAGSAGYRNPTSRI